MHISRPGQRIFEGLGLRSKTSNEEVDAEFAKLAAYHGKGSNRRENDFFIAVFAL